MKYSNCLAQDVRFWTCFIVRSVIFSGYGVVIKMRREHGAQRTSFGIGEQSILDTQLA